MFVVNLKRGIRYVLVFLGILLSVYLVLQSRWYLKKVYPIHYKDVITQYSLENDMDPFLIASVIYVESRFRPKALSVRGAKGLMQVMPETGRWIADELGIGGFEPEMLYEPMMNLRVGTWYLSLLRQEYNGDLIIALASYNAGRGNVKKWIDEKQWTGEKEDIDNIPFPETREYVKKVLYIYDKYRYVYRECWEE
ncbi:MAG: lytic transglycosylase domain-containing protein [Firmicutes bacterium]|jgi:soluble lytic murein transglycosylase|nr:lytic transglycosylase domain-containing protein [Bacillota bacterium]